MRVDVQRVRTGLVGLVAAVAFGTAGCTADGPSSALSDGMARGTSKAGEALPDVRPGAPYEFPMRNFCSTGPAVTITEVRPWRATGDIRIVDWGVRIYPNVGSEPGPNVGSVQERVSQVGGFTTGPVTIRCGSTAAVQQFSVSASTTRTRSTMWGVTVTTSTGQRLNTQFAIALCLTRSCASVPLS